jgi:hypothetical protein
MEVSTQINWNAFACIEFSIAFAICVFSVAGFVAIMRVTNKNYVPKSKRY